MKLYPPLLQSRILIISSVSMMALCACNPSDHSKDAAATTTAATVNGSVISESRVELLAKQGAAQGQPDNPEIRKKIIDQLSLQLLISQEAIKKGMDKQPEVLDQIDLTQQSILANTFVQDYLKSNPVNDDMVKAEYEKVKVQMGGSEYKARHILVEGEAEAKGIIAQLQKNPKAFDALAKAKSKDVGSQSRGGDLGWFDPHAMVSEFGAAVAKLAKGRFTEEPVKSQFGYHVIMLDDSRSKMIPPLDQIKPQLQQQVQQESLKKLLDELKAKAKIEITQITLPAVLSTETSKPDNKNKPVEASVTKAIK